MDSFAFMHLKYQQRFPKKIPMIPIPRGVAEDDICKDGGLLKYILENGKFYENPQDLDNVSVYYEAHLLDGTLVSKSHDYGVDYKVKDGHFCPALSRAVKTMKKEEKAILIVKPQYGFGEKGKPAHGDDEVSVPPNATLQITLKLFAWRKVPFLKTVRKAGEGYECPNKGAVVKLKLIGKLIGKLQDGTVFFTKGHGDDELFEFKTNEKQVIKGLRSAVMTMKKGEVASLTIGPKYAVGSQPKSDLVPPNSTVYYEVELVSFVKGKEISDTNTKETIEAARKKEKGKALDEAGEYERARKGFEKALKLISIDEKKYANGMKNYCNDQCQEDYYVEKMKAMIENHKKLRGELVLWPK